ncbi:hypothetical protein [Flavobacterium sp.]|uniref:hypothetical protein n=1 Tax=Flavobacterium sp. TaxID=239 RepID=UPI00374CB88B
MKKNNKLFLVIAIIGLIAGTLVKLTGNKTLGDIFLGLSTLLWLYMIIPVVYKIMTRKLRS